MMTLRDLTICLCCATIILGLLYLLKPFLEEKINIEKAAYHNYKRWCRVMEFSEIPIAFEEEVENKEYGTISLYFTLSLKALDYFHINVDQDEKPVCSCIWIEYPMENPTVDGCRVYISPTKMVEGGYSDYDWYEIFPDKAIIHGLLALPKRIKEAKAAANSIYRASAAKQDEESKQDIEQL